MKVKSSFLTGEYWLLIAAMLLAAGDIIKGQATQIAAIVVAGAFAWLRTWLKSRGS